MRRAALVVVLGCLFALGLGLATAAPPPRVCDKNPTNPHCQTSSSTNNSTSVTTATSSTSMSATTTTSTSTSTTTPTSTTTTPTPPPPPPSGWPRAGISYGWQVTRRDPTQDISYDLDLRARGVRFDYGWGSSGGDTLVGKLRSAGFDVYLVLGTTIKYPTSLTVSDVQSRCQAIAAKFAGQVSHFVFGNEPNINGWSGSAWVPYQHACFDGVRAGNSNAQLAVGALSPHLGSSADPTQWFAAYMSASLGRCYCDAIDVHLYDDATADANWSVWCMTFGCPNNYASNNVVGIAAGYGVHVPVVGGEAGGPYPKYSLSFQAQIVTDALKDPRPAATYVYSLRDNDDCTTACASSGYGLLDSALNKRPAYGSFQSAATG